MPIAFRESRDSDTNFIFATILKSYRYSNPIAKSQPAWSYYKSGSAELHNMFNCGVKSLIACDEEDTDLIIGFLVYKLEEVPTIHFAYTKAAFRSAGVAKDMCKVAGFDESKTTYYSRWTLDIMRLELEDKHKLRYNPYLFNWLWQQPLGEANERTNRENY